MLSERKYIDMKIENYFNWIQERHEIYLKRQQGIKKPWTDDKIFLENKFCNPFRENDKTTVWFRKNVREPLHNSDEIFLATVIFRWFNYIPTGEILVQHNLLETWDAVKAKQVLKNQPKLITGAYVIKTPDGMNKLDGIIWCINNIYDHKEKTIDFIKKNRSIKETTNHLTEYPYLGSFMAYEIATDLRHTHLLENATDIMTWANPGPGAVRGLNRIWQRPLKYKQPENRFISEMKYLLDASTEYLPCYVPPMEMRDIEHSLCEFDKYERIRLNEGQSKNKYNGYPEKENATLW